MKVLTIKNFKCFSGVNVPLNDMTIFCGPNAGGKSTVIQALLLLELALRDQRETIAINGPFGLQLGEAEGLLSREASAEAETDTIEISLADSNGMTRSVQLKVKEETPRQLVIVRPDVSAAKEKESFNFVYLSAERRGPRTIQESHSDDKPPLQTLGHAGEYTAELIVRHERTKIRDALRFPFDSTSPSGASSLFLRCVQDWMSSVFGPTEIQIRPNGNAPPSIYYQRPGVAEEWTIASNTGFGLSYALPIIVGGLLVPEGGTFIVDSPEAHLHPAAQTAIAKFLCWVAASGVGVILETHSDYVLDGVRIALTDSSRFHLSTERCTFLSISVADDRTREIEPIYISKKGKPTRWPKGFFDQQIKNMQVIDENIRAPGNADD